MRDNGSLRGRLLWNLALLLVVLMLASGLSAYWNGREAADTAYDRTLLASARTIAAGLSQRDGTLSADVPYVALDTFAYDSAGRIYYQVLDIHQKLISGYENLPGRRPARRAPTTTRRWRVSTTPPTWAGRARGQPAQGGQRTEHERHGGNPRGRNR
jgi:hypothetical protein